jgi:hypothetical protein
VETNVWNTFLIYCFEFNMNFQHYTLVCREENLGKSKAFLDLWNIELSPDYLLKKRRETVFKWSSEQFWNLADKKSNSLDENSLSYLGLQKRITCKKSDGLEMAFV